MTGFWGKIPSRGDFCGDGLSRSLVSAWDRWISACLAASQAAMGEAWQEAWMEAPVWFFQAAPGLFGPTPVSGLWMPSVDRAGRYFSLLIAAEAIVSADWFAAAEEAGRNALADVMAPDALLASLPQGQPWGIMPHGSVWWTEGAPRVAACQRRFNTLPGPKDFISMLDDAA